MGSVYVSDPGRKGPVVEAAKRIVETLVTKRSITHKVLQIVFSIPGLLAPFKLQGHGTDPSETGSFAGVGRTLPPALASGAVEGVSDATAPTNVDGSPLGATLQPRLHTSIGADPV